MTIRFGEYKKRDISFLLNFVTNPFLYYTGYNRKQKYTPGVCFYKIKTKKAEKQKEKE